MTWILSKLSGLLAPKYIGAFIRAVLQAIAGFLIAKGLPAVDVNHFIDAAYPVLYGLITWLTTVGWSFVQKQRNSD